MAVFDSNPLTPGLANYQGTTGPLQSTSCSTTIWTQRNSTYWPTRSSTRPGTSSCSTTGSSNVFPMMGYLKSNGVLQAFSKLGRHLVIHSVLIGGAGARETLGGLVSAVESLAADSYVAWLNSHLGPRTVSMANHSRKRRRSGESRTSLIGTVRMQAAG